MNKNEKCSNIKLDKHEYDLKSLSKEKIIS